MICNYYCSNYDVCLWWIIAFIFALSGWIVTYLSLSDKLKRQK